MIAVLWYNYTGMNIQTKRLCVRGRVAKHDT